MVPLIGWKRNFPYSLLYFPYFILNIICTWLTYLFFIKLIIIIIIIITLFLVVYIRISVNNLINNAIF